MTSLLDSFSSRARLLYNDYEVDYYRLDAVLEKAAGEIALLPYCLRVLLENLLRNEDGETVTREDILAVAHWDPRAQPTHEICFRPIRVLLQDFTGVPAVVDLAAMREALIELKGDPSRINPLQPVDLVIDHSVQVDSYGSKQAFETNIFMEFERNRERYRFLKWGQTAFRGLRVVPPNTGIVHQVNLEYLAQVVCPLERDGERFACPDSLVGTDSHTTMVNSLGVLGWGVGGIEAEAAMLGQPISMLVPQVVGFELAQRLRPGVTATDLVLTVAQMLRKKNVVGQFVEFFGDGLSSLSLPDRATIANMAPEYGATIGFFPVDEQTLAYLRLTGRSERQVTLVERYCKQQALFRDPGARSPRYTDTLKLDLSSVSSSLAGPRRPQDRIDLRESKSRWRGALAEIAGLTAEAAANGPRANGVQAAIKGEKGGAIQLRHGSVVIAAITSCTNTSNPAVLMAAGLLAKKAVNKGLASKPWVKTSFAPGSQVVTDYLDKAGLLDFLEKLGFHVVAYGCTTCIGNSGPLSEPVEKQIAERNLVAVSVLSGNRNFEGRINPSVRANYLASPPLVVAYALAGTMDIDFETEPLGHDQKGESVFLRDIWPGEEEISSAIRETIDSEMFARRYSQVTRGSAPWQSIEVPGGEVFDWQPDSTYIRKPPFFQGLSIEEPQPPEDIVGARVLALLGDSVTTDHISPAGSIAPASPAALYLQEQGISRKDFNSYGSRRGNHEVMVRGTFANIRLRNLLVPGKEGGITRLLPEGEIMSIYDAAQRYKSKGTPLLVIAGNEYGSGSSRDWAAKGTLLLGIKAVIAQSFERIHRSNLVGMGVLPLQFLPGESLESLGLSGAESFTITGIASGLTPGRKLQVQANERRFEVIARLDTNQEVAYYRHGGMLQYVLRQLAR
ncbi:MAG: aconitate hydratase AcnA [Deltaproteobacteria bacterium]|nr:aconitate hydratase AcnA [Deltaproteobacteria bacterium]